MSRGTWQQLLLVGIATLLQQIGLADPATGQPTDNEGAIASVAVFRTYSCGSGTPFRTTTVRVSSHGNVIGFESPGGASNEHIMSGDVRSGFEVCYSVPGVGYVAHYDFGTTESAGWSAPSVSEPNGVGRFPMSVSRTTPDGRVRVTREFSGNSFFGPVNPGNPTFDSINANGAGCDVLGECGNCTNRTIHVITRLTNLTALTLGTVRYQEVVDFDVSRATDGSSGNNLDIFVRTADSVIAVDGDTDEFDRSGMLLQALLLPSVADVFAYSTSPTGCSAAPGVATPTPAGDYEARALTEFGTLGPGANTANTFRVHYRRF